MPKLYMMCGPSGAGKTTWAHNFINENSDMRYVSRDEVRYSIIKDNEEYFSHEKEVFRKFVAIITETLIDGFDVIADATHLNEFSRRKLTQAIDMYYTDYKIIYVVPNVSYDLCIEHNKNRTGRAKVPENIIANMCRDFRFPSLNEDDRAIDIWEVDTNV